MKDESLTIEPNFRRFLLGEMPEAERSEFEQSFILDEELFERLQVAEDELIENYLLETLCPVDRQKFEANYLTSDARRRRVAFMREMLQKVSAASALKKRSAERENASIWTGWGSFLKPPQIAFGSAFVILVLILGGWFFYRKSGNPNEIAIVTPTISVTPTPTPTVLPAANSNLDQTIKPDDQNTNQFSANINKSKANTEPTPKKTEPGKPLVATLILFTGGVRSDGKNNELNLPPNSAGANLQLNLETRNYEIYRAEIIDQNGKVVYRSGNLSAAKAQPSVFVPAKYLLRGDYLLKLYGLKKGQPDESVADFQFRVNQK